MSTKSRNYLFKLPYHISRDNLPMFAARIIVADLWEKLPRSVATKINIALDQQSSIDLENTDFNQIRDDVWTWMSKEFDLQSLP